MYVYLYTYIYIYIFTSVGIRYIALKSSSYVRLSHGPRLRHCCHGLNVRLETTTATVKRFRSQLSWRESPLEKDYLR